MNRNLVPQRLLTHWLGVALLTLNIAGSALCADAPAPPPTPAPPSAQVIEKAPVFEIKSGWKFDDDQLIFANPNQNGDGKRYVVWKDYQWAVSDDLITIYDTRPYGATFSAKRKQVDEDGKPLKDKDIMNDMKDHAKDIREANTPRPPPPPPGYYDDYYGSPVIGGSFFFFHGGGGHRHH